MHSSYGIFTLHGNGNWTRNGIKGLKKNAEIFTVVQDRDRDKYPLIDIVPVLFPVPPFFSLAPGPAPMQCE